MTTGVLSALGWALLSAVFSVWGYILLQQWPVQIVVLAAFLPTVGLALIWSYLGSSKTLSPYCKDLRGTLINLNIVTAICWIATFLALERILPATFASISVGLIPLATAILNRAFRKQAIKKRIIEAAIISFAGIIALSFHELFGKMQLMATTQVFLGIAASILVAVFAAASLVYSKKMNDAGVDARGVFGSRFWLVLLISAIWVFFTKGYPTTPITLSPLYLVLFGIVGIAVPTFFGNISVEKIGPKVLSFLMTLMPVFAYGLQLLAGINQEVTLLPAVGIVLVTLGLLHASGSVDLTKKRTSKKAAVRPIYDIQKPLYVRFG